ncbi:hypothetical protein ACFVR2_22935 [Gottfriedia sp. NPDC057991]|uniref:hypothetical protein n=1 Tax=Gottfriedia sp. NPDC057991 TaxID=3346298 RepID=UPI0036D9800A
MKKKICSIALAATIAGTGINGTVAQAETKPLNDSSLSGNYVLNKSTEENTVGVVTRTVGPEEYWIYRQNINGIITETVLGSVADQPVPPSIEPEVIEENTASTQAFMNTIQSIPDTGVTDQVETTSIPVEGGGTIIATYNNTFSNVAKDVLNAALTSAVIAVTDAAGKLTRASAITYRAYLIAAATNYINTQTAPEYTKTYIVRSWSSYYNRYVYNWYTTTYTDSSRSTVKKVHISHLLFNDSSDYLYY